MKKINLLQPSCTQDEIDAVTEVLKSGWWGTGPKTIEFEKKFAEYTHSKGCIAVNSCTSALHLALRAAISILGVYDIDRPNIVVPSLTFVSTGLVGLYEDVEVRFADIDADTLCMNMDSAMEHVDKNTIAVIPVHYGGVTADVQRLKFLLEQKSSNALIIEDCAHATGNPDVGKVGIVSCWSFHPVKNLATGDMGAITYNEDIMDDFVEEIIQERWCGISQDTYKREKSGYNWEYNISRMGYKYNTNDIMASIALVQLKRIWEMNGKRGIIADRYYKGLQYLPITLMPKSGSCHLFVIRVDEKLRNPLIDFLRENNISPGVHYKPIHTYPIWGEDRVFSLPVTEQVSKEIISLPIHADLTEEEQKYIIGKLKEFFHARED